MLSRAGFRDQSGFAETFGQQRLSDYVVDLMRACMIQVFSLQIDLRAAELFRQPRSVRQQRRSSDIFVEHLRDFRLEFRIVLIVTVAFFDFQNRVHQCFGDVSSSELAEAARIKRLRAAV